MIRALRGIFSNFSSVYCFLRGRNPFAQPAVKKMTESEEEMTTEGKARVFLPPSVFYNPVQEFNRDLTIAIISEFAKEHFAKQREKNKNSENEESSIPTKLEAGVRYENGIRICEALAASGLRSVRFGLEIPGVKEIIANDLDESAVEYIKKNVKHNGIEDLVKPSINDASMLMYLNKRPADRFDVIDLDPYGSAAPFLDAALQSIRDGGLICCTCTDAAILCGNAGETCFAKYGAFSVRTKFCHEKALRIVLQCIQSHASTYGRYIEPVISLSIDFYVRIFFRVYSKAGKVKAAVTKLSNVYYCGGCGGFTLQPLASRKECKGPGNFKYLPGAPPGCGDVCEHCNSHLVMAGPVWNQPLHNKEFIQKIIDSLDGGNKLNTEARIRGMLSMAQEELPDVPLYYILDDLCSVLHVTPMTILQLRSAILNAGYRVSFSHAAKNSVKTDAPPNVIWDIMRCWTQVNPVKSSRLEKDNPARSILEKKPVLQADFTLHPEANPESRKKGLVRWQMKPLRDWGPKARASDGGGSLDERREKGQMKAKRKRENENESTTKKTKAEEEVDKK